MNEQGSFFQGMTKPIVYQHIEEKEALERALLTTVPLKKRAAASKALMDIFATAKNTSVKVKSRKK